MESCNRIAKKQKNNTKLMRAVISSTFDSKYLFFLPITTFLWNKLGVDVICFLPAMKFKGEQDKIYLINHAIMSHCSGLNMQYTFVCPEHKEATYAQCSRLYGACLDLPEDEILCVSDVDMVLFQVPPYVGGFTVFGSDLVPEKQYPMCYISASVKDWRSAFELNGKMYQHALDELLGHIEAEHFRGNYWGKDQEEAFNKISTSGIDVNLVPRARPQTQWATKRYDRDDAYILDRLSLDTIDYHLNRPGYEQNNFNIIMTVLKYHYPNEDFSWLEEYRRKYMELL